MLLPPLCISKITLERSTTQPQFSRWNRKSSYCGLSSSLISLSKAQPLNRLISWLWSLSYTHSEITLESSTTQPFHLQTLMCLCLTLSLISLLKSQPLNHFIFQLWSLSFTHSEITLKSSTTQPFHLQTQICMCLTLSLSDITLERSTTQPLHLPTVVSLLHFLWYHSWKLNHSTISSPNSDMSVPHSLSLISLLKAKPLNHFIFQLWCLSFTLSDITLESSTTQPLHLLTVVSLRLSLWYHSWKLNHSTISTPNYGLSPSLTLISLLKAQPLNHFISQLWYICASLSLISLLKAQPLNHFMSQLWSLSGSHSDITLESSTTQPFHLQTLVSLPHSLWYHSWKPNHSTTSSPNCGLSPSLTLT